MSKRQYTKYDVKEDHLSVISAEDINALQRAVEALQENSFAQADDAFLDRAIASLGHHPEANAMVVNVMDGTAIGVSTTHTNTYLDPITRSLRLSADATEGHSVATVVNPTAKPFLTPLMLSDHKAPEGTSVTYEISYDGQTYYPVTPNQAHPLEVDVERSTVYIRIGFSRTDIEQEPRVDAWAIMYGDETYGFRFLDDGIDIGIESLWDGTIVE